MRTGYDPDGARSAGEWLSLDEGVRQQLVEAYHRRKRIRLPNPRLHAAFHVIVENQLALGEEVVVDTVTRLRADGLSRHAAIHAAGTVLAGHVHDILAGQPPDPNSDPNASYFEELKKLTGANWRAGQWPLP